MKIVFASANEGKVKEIREMLEGMGIELLSLKDYRGVPEIVEDRNIFLENALKKAQIISEFTGETVLADDSGLSVDALRGARVFIPRVMREKRRRMMRTLIFFYHD